MRRLPGIHGLRAVAALGIVLFHVAYMPSFMPLPPILGHRIVPIFFLCVPLFFVISAFSLAYSHDKSIGQEGWIWPYLIKRVFRIAPLFYAMLPACHYAGSTEATIASLLTNVTFIFNFIPGQHESLVWAGWSIGVEMPFYVCFPFILARIRTPLGASILLVICATISIAARLWFARQESGWPQDYYYTSLVSNVAFFAAGLLAFCCFALWSKHRTVWRWAGLITVASLALLFPFRSLLYYPGQPDDVLWGCVFGLLCAWQAARPSRWLASGAMQWLGERSYSIYLLHSFVIVILATSGMYARIQLLFSPIGWWAYLPCAAVTLAIVISAAGVTYVLIEKPGQRLGTLIIKRYCAGRSTLAFG